jgi:plastocyanin
LRFPLGLLIFSLLVPALAFAQGDTTAPAPIVVEIEGHVDGSSFYFVKAGETAKNPTLTFLPGQQVTFKFTVVTGSHNLHISDGGKTAVLNEGDASVTLEWTAPTEAANLEYWCDPHKASGMKGRIIVAEASAAGSDGVPAGEIGGDTLDLGAAFPNNPACQGKKASSLVDEAIVGIPKLQDYDNPACTTGYTPPKPKHVVDYVIPLSWGLIGLGIVGVVWVHKYYKP